MAAKPKYHHEYSLDEIEDLMDLKGIYRMDEAILLLDKMYRSKRIKDSTKKVLFSFRFGKKR